MQSRSTLSERMTMLHQIIQDHTITLDCEAVESALSLYHQATLQGQHESPDWATIRTHLAHCPSCTQALRGLQEAAFWTQGLEEIGPDVVPTPDLTFLTAPTVQPEALWSRLLRGIVVNLQLAWEQAVTPPLVDVGARQSAATASRRYSLPEAANSAVDARAVTISFTPSTQHSEQYHLLVTLAPATIPGELRFIDTEVQLLISGTIMATQLIDSAGEAQFTLSAAELDTAQILIIPDGD